MAGRVPLPDVRRERRTVSRGAYLDACSGIRSCASGRRAALAETTIVDADEPRNLVSRQDRRRSTPVKRAATALGLQDRIRAAAADGAAALHPRRRDQGLLRRAARRRTARRSRLRRHRRLRPGELVVTARAGTPLVEIEDALARSGQMLAFEPPHYGRRRDARRRRRSRLLRTRAGRTPAPCAISCSACASSTAPAKRLRSAGR